MALIKGLSVVGSLDPPHANHLITQLQSAGVTDPYLFEAIRGIANTPGKPAAARAAREVLTRLVQAKSAWEMTDASSGREDTIWAAAGAVISVVVVEPRLKLLTQLSVADARFAFYSVSNNITRRVSVNQIEHLTVLNEDDLKALKTATSLLQRHVAELNRAKQDLARLSK